MGKFLISAVCLLLIHASGQAQEPDEVAKKIMAAKDTFYAERDKAEELLLAALARKEAAAKQAGDIKTIEAVRAETESFRTEGKLPKSVPLTTYESAMNLARTKLENAYSTGIKSYTRADQLDQAKELQKELEEFLEKLNLRTKAKPPLKSSDPPMPKEPPEPSDPLQPNTMWSDAKGVRFMKIAERKDDAFSGTFGNTTGGWELAGTGSIKDDTFVFTVKGTGGTMEYRGKMNLKEKVPELDMTWHDLKKKTSGKFVMLKK